MMKMMYVDEEMISTIDVIADDYEEVRGDSFNTKIDTNGRKIKCTREFLCPSSFSLKLYNTLKKYHDCFLVLPWLADWWRSNSLALLLIKVARGVVSLCYPSFACEAAGAPLKG
jgi:hypothetical protein